jgi:trehalose synthase
LRTIFVRSSGDRPASRTIKGSYEDYEPIVGRGYIEELRQLGARLSGKVIQNINSTYVGGGVAEILSHLVPLCNQIGVDIHWDIIKGTGPFFDVTKKFHNALHGKEEIITPDEFALFMEITQKNLDECRFTAISCSFMILSRQL